MRPRKNLSVRIVVPVIVTLAAALQGCSQSGSVARATTEPTVVASDSPTVAVASQTNPAPSNSGRRVLVLGQGALLLRGKIDRELGVHAANDDFVADRDAVLHLELRQNRGADAAAPLAIAADVKLTEGLLVFPIEYELHGDPTKLVADGSYFLSAQVTNGPKGSGPHTLASEYRNEVIGGEREKDFLVTGLELCGSPNAGGFCGG
ncbi:MAG: hypothetical protein U0271_03625 [Polyangiaceae bacterium]